MEQINEKLNQLTEQISRQRKLRAMIDDLRQQQTDLSQEVQALREQTYREQLDVDRLEKLSPTKLLYQLLGKLDEQMEKEEEEVCAVALRYDAKRRELQGLEADLAARERELEGLRSAQADYDKLLLEKKQLMKTMNAYYGERICALEERIAYLRAQSKETREAIQAGREALRDVESIQSALSSAEGWGTFDLFGGDTIATLVKHSHLDEAQRQVTSLQRSLSRFRTELADITVYTDLHIQIDGFLRFADYFFDGVFADWAVLDRIHNSQNQVSQVEHSVSQIISRLESSMNTYEQEIKMKERELQELVLKA